MLFTDIDYLTEDFNVEHGYVGTDGPYIAYVGEGDPSYDMIDFGERYDGHGKLLMPGMVNAHTHAPMTLLRGYAENLPLQQWLNDKVFPFEAHISDEAAYYATQLAMAEMLRFGTVSFSDMYDHSDERARAVLESGMKANLCHGLTVFDGTPYGKLPHKAVNEHLVDAYHNAADGKLKIDLNIHAEYTTTPQVVKAVGKHAAELGVRTHIHMSETKAENDECKQRHNGMTPAKYFESLGFFEMPCTVAHCVWVTAGDIKILAKHNATIACNPASNMKLASGFAPVDKMLASGINIALGTDGPASNNNHNLMKEIYLFATMYKGSTADPTLVTPAEALRAATVGGALAQGRDDTGIIKAGMRADIAVLDTDVPWMQPVTNAANNLVYSAQGSDVCLTMVDGQVLYKDGEWTTIDAERAAWETQKATEAIQAQL